VEGGGCIPFPYPSQSWAGSADNSRSCGTRRLNCQEPAVPRPRPRLRCTRTQHRARTALDSGARLAAARAPDPRYLSRIDLIPGDLCLCGRSEWRGRKQFPGRMSDFLLLRPHLPGRAAPAPEDPLAATLAESLQRPHTYTNQVRGGGLVIYYGLIVIHSGLLVICSCPLPDFLLSFA